MSIRDLELIAHRSWPARAEDWYDGWLLRYAEGVTRRANSISPVDRSRLDLPEKIVECEHRYEQRDLPPIFRLCPITEPGLEDLLAERGYRRSSGADILTRPIDRRDAGESVPVSPHPSPEWIRGLGEGGFASRMPIFDRLTETGRAGFGYLEGTAGPVAVGIGVVTDSYLAVFNMQTLPQYRRRGMGRRLLCGLLGWGAARGATTALLQVEPHNRPAQQLYRSAGFEKQYEYWYRQPV